MDARIISICFLLFFSATIELNSQTVTVSNEISIRNNVAYDLIGRVGDKILFYKDKGNEREVFLYDDDLVFQSERQINLDKKRCELYDVVNLDTAFAIFYGYRDDGQDFIKMDIFSNTASRLDSIVISRENKDWKGLQYQTVQSDDESKIALYDIVNSDKLRVVIIDINQKKAIKEKEYVFEDINLFTEMEQIVLANDGNMFILTQSDNMKSRRKYHVAHIYKFTPGSEDINDIQIPLNDIVCQDLIMSLDNANDKIGIAGLYDEKKSDESTGYFWIAGNISTFGSQDLVLIPFEEEIFFEVYGERNKGRMENFAIADVLWKSNSAPIIILEMSYDVSRRVGGLTYADRGTYYPGRSLGSPGGWSDHYRDDLVLISLNENGKKEWHQVFYKKQFSQNDNAVFSSFYPFVTPSRMRLIYNDEIKHNSTVSEYILDATGNYKRTSVLSTDYQDLKLRFADANQISSTELLVPSQKSYGVNIVKIDFGQ